jgi:hypothetical protein
MVKTMGSIPPIRFPYNVIRNVSSPEDDNAERKRYAGNASATSFFDLPDDENVRAFLERTGDGTKRKPTLVNLRIRQTLEEAREEFSILNGGVVVVARGAEIDDKARIATLHRASIINGSQTRGILKEWFKQNQDDRDFPNVSFELIVCDDEELIAEISIARNTQNDVKAVSIYGRRGLFEELNKSMAHSFPDQPLRMSETDFGDEYLDTEKLVQVLTVLAPAEIAFPSTSKRPQTEEGKFRIYAYNHRARTLQDFATVMGGEDAMRGPFASARRFILDVAPAAWRIYKSLKTNASLARRIHRVEREDGRIAPDGVPDGIVFPVLSALSQFVAEARGSWKLEIPNDFDLNDLCSQANHTYTRGAGGNNPNVMGKTGACYHHLHSVVATYLKYAHR